MAETNGLLNRRTGKSGTEGSNPSVSATLPLRGGSYRSTEIEFLPENLNFSDSLVRSGPRPFVSNAVQTRGLDVPKR